MVITLLPYEFNSVDPDKLSDLGLHSSPRPICPNISGKYDMSSLHMTAASDQGLHCLQKPIYPNTNGYYATAIWVQQCRRW